MSSSVLLYNFLKGLISLTYKLYSRVIASVFQQLNLLLGPCKTGHYCNQNSSKELPCKEGTYNNINGSFKESNCRICPINSYCPSGSVMPTQCPKEKFSPSRSTKVKLYQGKGKPGDCRSCPVDPCDKEGKGREIF